MRLADAGIAELQRYVDTLIVIPNQNLFRVANERTTFAEAFGMADQVLHSGVRSITDLMVLPGLINLDFADVRTVMTEMGKAMMGTGEASGRGSRADGLAERHRNPLLDEVSLKGAKAVLVNVTGGLDMTLLEVDEAANAISDQVESGRQHHLRRGVRSVAGRQDPRLGGRHRHGRNLDRRHRAQAGSRRRQRPAAADQRTRRRGATASRRLPAAAQRPLVEEPVGQGPSRNRRLWKPSRKSARSSARARPQPTNPPRPISMRPRPRRRPAGTRPAFPRSSVRRRRNAPLPAPNRTRTTRRCSPTGTSPKSARKAASSACSAEGARATKRRLRRCGDYRGDPTPVLQARAAAAAQVAPGADEEVQPESTEDLEIPSFLRRLAN